MVCQELLPDQTLPQSYPFMEAVQAETLQAQGCEK